MKLKILLPVFIFMYCCTGFGQFITEWNTGGTTSITVPTTGTGYNYTATIALLSSPAVIITTLSGVTANANFTGLQPNTEYQVKITGSFPRIYFNYAGDRLKIKNITQWGSIAWTSFNKAFYGCTGLNISAIDVPLLSGVTSMNQMFQYCSALNGPANIGSWNTATVTDMYCLFNGATAFNQNIGNWNTASVTDMSTMFGNATAFNQDIGSWNTGSLTTTYYMFGGATAFNQNIGSWNTAAVTSMNAMFQGATSFNQPVGSWDTAAVTDFSNLFSGATAFNQPLGNWNTSAATTMQAMFTGAVGFNQDISSWNTSAVTTMAGMFASATGFNRPLGNWNTALVTSLSGMFQGAAAFNQDISSWDVSNVLNMEFLFQNATSFNQDISSWDVSSAIYMDAMLRGASAFDQNLGPMAAHFNPAMALNSFFGGMLDNCGMSVATYDATLIGFNNLGPDGLALGAAGMYYCNDGNEARAHLVLPVAAGGKGWTIAGDTSLVTATPLLAAGGTTAALQYAGCNYNWSKPANCTRTMLQVNPNDNAFSPSGVVVNNNAIGVLPAGVTAVDGYYQVSTATNSTRISNCLASITDVAAYPENGGITVRVYYATAEYTSIVVSQPPVGQIIDAGWFRSDSMAAAAVVAGMGAGTYALPDAEKIIPVNSGSENGIAFAEFKITKPGTIGMYAKTQQGPLAPALYVAGVEGAVNAILYPNPAGATLNLILTGDKAAGEHSMAILNMLGQTMYTATGGLTGIDISFLSSGLYHILLTTNNGTWKGRFIKE